MLCWSCVTGPRLSQALQKYYKEARKGAGSKLTIQDTANACMDMVTAAYIGMEGFTVYKWNDLGPNFRAHGVKQMGKERARSGVRAPVPPNQ